MPSSPKDAKLHREIRRNRAIKALGGRCIRCGISHPLCFDHVNGGGTRERRRNHDVARNIAGEILAGEREKYQLLCHNCNCLKSFFPDDYAQPPFHYYE